MTSEGPPLIGNGVTKPNEVVDTVRNLCSLPIPTTLHPNLHALARVLYYKIDSDTGFCDRNAFSCAMAKYLEEAAEQSKMTAMMEQGHNLASMLYTWRSCTLPIAKIRDQSNSAEVNQKTLDILEPEIQKLKEFKAFQEAATAVLESEVKRLCSPRTEFVSEAHLLSLGKFISTLATLDELKNSKSSIRNDYSNYKRAFEQLRRDPSLVGEMHDLSMFLATHNIILQNVKKAMSSIAGYEDVWCQIINTSVNWYEQKLYLVPDEKNTIVKVIGFLLYLIDSDQVNINKLKQLNLAKIDAIFKEMEVVPLFGDVVIGPFNYVTNLKTFDKQHWPRCSDGSIGRQATLLSNMVTYRLQHSELICELMMHSDERHKIIKMMKTRVKAEQDDMSKEKAKSVYDTTVKCLRTLSMWTSYVTELFSWKLLHPAPAPQQAEGAPEPEVYERATRYNYSSEEKSALAELIGMIKSVQCIVQRLEPILSRAVYSHIYQQLQDFVHNVLNEPLRKAEKHKKDVIKSILLAVKNVCMDLSAAVKDASQVVQPVQKKKTKGSEATDVQPLLVKAIKPSSTQLYLVRTMLESLVEKSDRSKSKRKDMAQPHVEAIESFLQASFFWSNLMDLSGTLQVCCDLGQLWYREFYLEMTKGERLQFPIEMSLPWILMSHLLDSKDPYLIQHLLYPLDLYNDSAQFALQRFKKQFLYDEIEAEVRLCFDQLVYKLSEHIYEYYRTMASLILLDRTFKSQLTRLKVPVYTQRPINYVCLMGQRNIQLLGRTVNLHLLIGQQIMQFLIKSLETAFSRYEATGFTGLVELESLVKVSRLTHRLLAVHLPLDSFDLLFDEANINVTSPYGRIAIITLVELVSHILPHYCYNGSTNRFVKTVLPFADEEKRERVPQTAHYNLWGNKELNGLFMAIYGRYHGFIGDCHFTSLVSLIGYQDMAMILKELLENVRTVLSSSLVSYLTALQSALPKKCILPRYEYTSPGVLGYFQAQLTDIVTYADLQPKVFQRFREFGNALIIMLMLQQALFTRESTEIVLSGMFMRRIPLPFIPKKSGSDGGKQPTSPPPQQEGKDGATSSKSSVSEAPTSKSDNPEVRQALEQLDKKYRHYHVQGVLSKRGNEEQAKIVHQTNLLTHEKLTAGLSTFAALLHRMSSVLVDSPIWNITSTSGGAWDVVHNVEFYRLWSAMQFVFCRPSGPNEYTVESLFGDGLNWAGCALIVVLGQQRRFETTDFCYHLQRIHKVDQLDKVCDGVDLRKFVDRIRRFQILNDEIFGILNKHLNFSQDRVLHNYNVNIEHFEPPSTAAGSS